MERQYTIYKLTSPSGKYYIGLTKNSIKERWRQHVKRAFTENRNHPLYNAIRKYGPDSFIVEGIGTAPNKKAAQMLEMRHIANSPKDLLYNLSAGGEADGEAGGHIFWESINADPERRAEYIKTLSDIKRGSDWSDYGYLSQKAQAWRKENPREAYRLAYRALRLANKTNRAVRIKAPGDDRPLKERLMWKHKRPKMARKSAKALWARRTEAEKVDIGAKISVAQKERMKDVAILPDFKQEDWPYAKATVLRKIRQGMGRDEIIKDAIEVVKGRGSHWRDVRQKLTDMGALECEHMTS